MNKAKLWSAAFSLLLGVSACSGSSGPQGGGGGDTGAGTEIDAGVAEVDAAPEIGPYEEALANREVDYLSALRIAALRLTGDLPTLADMKSVQGASDKQTAYDALITQYIADPRFSDMQIEFWQNTLKLGGDPLLDSAGIFAAQLVVENRSYLELLTATTGTCPTYDTATKVFTAADCTNNTPVHAGLLTHPGMNKSFISNMAFRRTRWVQEIFACTAFPAETGDSPQQLSPTAVYTAPWDFGSIADLSTGDINFQDYQSVVCANCHATMNHLAPLLSHYDATGNYTAEISVPKPTAGNPMTTMGDWLPSGEVTAWRLGVPAADLPELGAAMAADPKVAECAVARAWNWAMGKGDIVDSLSIVPPEVFNEQYDYFVANGYDYKTLLYQVFTSADFIRF